MDLQKALATAQGSISRSCTTDGENMSCSTIVLETSEALLIAFDTGTQICKEGMKTGGSDNGDDKMECEEEDDEDEEGETVLIVLISIVL